MKRRLPLILVSVVIVICVVGAVVAAVAAGTGEGAAAYSVDGKQVSQATVNDELSWLANSPAVQKSVASQGGTLSNSRGSINADFAANWLTRRIEVDLLRSAAQRSRVTVSDATRAKVRKQAAQQYKGAPGSLLDTQVDLTTYLKALDITDDTGAANFFGPAFAKSHVTVDPRYGTWHPLQGVCPPAGCPVANSAGG